MYIEIKEQIKFMNDIVTREREDIKDYQRDMCMLAFIVGKINGLIECSENKKSGGINGNTIHGSRDTKATSKTEVF